MLEEGKKEDEWIFQVGREVFGDSPPPPPSHWLHVWRGISLLIGSYHRCVDNKGRLQLQHLSLHSTLCVDVDFSFVSTSVNAKQIINFTLLLAFPPLAHFFYIIIDLTLSFHPILAPLSTIILSFKPIYLYKVYKAQSQTCNLIILSFTSLYFHTPIVHIQLKNLGITACKFSFLNGRKPKRSLSIYFKIKKIFYNNIWQ